MSTRQERNYMRMAQKIARDLETACEGDLYSWFEGTHIGTQGDNTEDDNLVAAQVIFGDCPWTTLEFDVKRGIAYLWYGCGKARVPQRALYELEDFFSSLHHC